MPLVCSHSASRLCSAAPQRTFFGAEVSFQQGPANSTQPNLYTFAVQCSVQKPWGLQLGSKQIARKVSGFVVSGLQRYDPQVGVSRLNAFALDRKEDEQREQDDREEVKLKIPVGPTRNCLEQTFTFKRILGPSSVFVVVTLRKPLGIILEAVRRGNRERVVVADLVQGSNAQRAARVNQMFQGTDNNRKTRAGSVILNGDARPGDILRATTTVGVVVDLFGIRAPQRVMMLHVADGRCWDDTMAALKASFVADGPLTLVLEREL